MTKVFISSTGLDLQEYRQAAINVCNELGIIPLAMEFFEAMGDGATVGSKRKLDDADLYVGIFAHRYGYIEKGYSKSVTEIEFDYAGERKLDRLCFIVDPDHPWAPSAIDHKHYKKLEAFKKQIESTVIRIQFTTVDNFAKELYKTLETWLRDHHQPVNTTAPPPSKLTLNTAPPAPLLVIGRTHDIEKIKARLGIPTGDMKTMTLMRGLPGVGKTTFINTLSHDSDVKKAFPDGIFWAACGENANPYNIFVQWLQALNTPIPPSQTLEDAAAAVRNQLADKKALIIVDDVWKFEDALPFKVGGSDCASIVTTRFMDIAQKLAPSPTDVYLLGHLSSADGLALLEKVAPRFVAQYAKQAVQLVEDLEGLPLTIQVAGRWLERELEIAPINESILADLTRESILYKEAPVDRYDPETGLIPTVSLILKKSTDALDSDTRLHFMFLGSVAPKPATFGLNLMEKIWRVSDGKPIVRKLVDRGLLEPIPSLGRFQMHAVLVMHAKALAKESQ